MWTCGQCRRRPKGKQRWVCRAGQTRAVDARSASCGRISARRKWWAIKYVLMELIRDAGMDSAARRMFSHLCRRSEGGWQSNKLYNYAGEDLKKTTEQLAELPEEMVSKSTDMQLWP